MGCFLDRHARECAGDSAENGYKLNVHLGKFMVVNFSVFIPFLVCLA